MIKHTDFRRKAIRARTSCACACDVSPDGVAEEAGQDESQQNGGHDPAQVQRQEVCLVGTVPVPVYRVAVVVGGGGGGGGAVVAGHWNWAWLERNKWCLVWVVWDTTRGEPVVFSLGGLGHD